MCVVYMHYFNISDLTRYTVCNLDKSHLDGHMSGHGRRSVGDGVGGRVLPTFQLGGDR